MGTHELNRDGLDISGKHCHSLARTVEKNGFSASIYKFIIVLLVDDADLNMLFNHNDKMSKKDPRLPNVTRKLRVGSIARSHIVWVVRMFKDGSILWDDTKELMKPPIDDESLRAAMDDGLVCQIIRRTALKNDIDGVRAVTLPFCNFNCHPKCNSTMYRYIHYIYIYIYI